DVYKRQVLNQYNTLKMAKRKNLELKVSLEKMKIKNQQLIKKIEYATTSAYIDQQKRELLALGTEGDVWLDLPENSENITYKQEINETKTETNWGKWIQLFTQ
ncbi:MAG: hypothetical protein KIH89_001785, partial [Candidatus Shapirobacteria bacterium]|nr:hypothetical protein [Candidatus Shapirobacteria bacterium]